MTVENIGRSFPQEFQKRIDQREIRQKLIRPVDHRHRDQPVQGKLEMLQSPFAVEQQRHQNDQPCGNHKLQQLVEHFIFHNGISFQSLQHVSVRKAHRKRHHEEILCQMHVLFQKETSRKKHHGYGQPAIFLIEAHREGHEYDQQYFQA